MHLSVFPSNISGTAFAPASKSYFIRAVAMGMLTNGITGIKNASDCDDAMAMVRVAQQMGAAINSKDDTLFIKGGLPHRGGMLDCGESALAARLMIPVAALSGDEFVVDGLGTLKNRKIGSVEEVMKQLGAACETTGGYLPVRVKGPLRGGHLKMDGSQTSQLLSGLLMALPFAGQSSLLEVENLKSRPYIDLTLQVLQNFGIVVQHEDYRIFKIPGCQTARPANVKIGGDWSGGAFLLVAGAIAGDLLVKGLETDSAHGDRQILNVLQKAGVNIEIQEAGILVRKGQIQPFEFDATHCPDLFPPLAVMAACANGTSRIKGIHRLKNKESRRDMVLQQELRKLGISIILQGDEMLITGGAINSGTVDPHGDHRIAMAAAIAALGATNPVTIINAGCVSKSWPGFFDELARLNVKIIRS